MLSSTTGHEVQYSLKELAELTDSTLHGDENSLISSVKALDVAGVGAISFYSNNKYKDQLERTKASAVILNRASVGFCPTNALIHPQPYYCFAMILELFYPQQQSSIPVIDPSAKIAKSAQIVGDVCIEAQVVIEDDVVIDQGARIGPHSVIQRGTHVGANTQLIANVTLCHNVKIGKNCKFHPGVVIGADGFGFASFQGIWHKVLQLGTVIIGDDVEIGANTCIDRGSMHDTLIGKGVKLDNLIQIGHNVQIGDHTVIAGSSAIAGSATIGKNCMLAGCTAITGHIKIGDNCTIHAMTLVTKSVGSGEILYGCVPSMKKSRWRRVMARLRHLDQLFDRVKSLENKDKEKKDG